MRELDLLEINSVTGGTGYILHVDANMMDFANDIGGYYEGVFGQFDFLQHQGGIPDPTHGASCESPPPSAEDGV